MASTFLPTTPSPPPDLPITPPAPKFGTYHDNWEAYPSRTSARISSQRASVRTPSPRASNIAGSSSRAGKKTARQTHASMVSPMASPQKKRQPDPNYSRRVSGNLTADSSSKAAAALGLPTKQDQKHSSSSVARTASMLVTPAKTPQKPTTAKSAAEIELCARNLFSSDEAAVASPHKRRTKKHSGMTMDSFTAEQVEEPIQIFTDCQDRIPQKDESPSNPFYGNHVRLSSPPKRRSHRKQVVIPGEGPVSIEDAARREDGMLFTFRGKTFFRKISEHDGSHLEDREADEDDYETRLSRPLTRASVKPRLLFPKEKTQEMIDEEEATTDVEDTYMAEVEHAPHTPTKALQGPAGTPAAPRYAPASPPDTKRITRSANKLATKVEGRRGAGSRASPFDAWRRTKDRADKSVEKRSAESLENSQAKRTRA